jgi:HlyD family secretion protein
MRRAILSVAALAVIAALAAVWFRGWTPRVMAESGPVVPTARVARGAIELTVYMTGDLRASRQAALVAPSVGGSLRILKVLESGASVTSGDTIMEFDPADQQYALEQAESTVAEADQEIIKRRADTLAQEAQDKVTLLTAGFDVRRAELDAAVDEGLIPANDYKIRQVSLEEARRKLEQVKADVQSRAVTGKAALSVLEERRNKAKLDADRAKQNMQNLVVTAPIDGVVAIRENQDAAGGIFFSGMTLPSYRVGDTVYAGRPIADVFDISGMEIRARVNEQERSNVAEGQAARVDADAVAGLTLDAKVTAVAGLGRPDRNSGPLRLFDVTLELDRPDARLRPGTSVRVTIPGRKVEDVLVLPRQAVFERDGKPVVLARTADGFEAKSVKILHRNESTVAVEGVDEGLEVALVDPDEVPRTAATATPAPPGGGR